jgi:hypothetical protein
MGLLLGLARRRVDLVSLCPAYLGLLLAWFLVVLTGFIFRDHLTLVSLLKEQALAILAQDSSRIGGLTVSWGQSLYVGLAGAFGGFVLTVPALARMHRTSLGRVMFGLLVVVLLSGAGLVLFAGELGLDRVHISL